MPLLDFKCRFCGTVVELLVRRIDSVPPSCEACGEDSLERDGEIQRSNFALAAGGVGWAHQGYSFHNDSRDD